MADKFPSSRPRTGVSRPVSPAFSSAEESLYVDEESPYMERFQSISRGIERLEKLGVEKTFPKGYILSEVGSVPTECYIVKTGRVIAFEYTYTGEQRIYNFMEPGSIFLEECMLFDKACPIMFRTVTESRLVIIDKCDLKRAFKHDIDVVMDICEALTDKYLAAMELQRLSPHQGATWQICSFFLMAARHYGVEQNGEVVIREKMSQQTIADLLGMNRVTVTRKLGELREKGIVEKRDGRFVIKSIDSLQRYMDAIRYLDE